MKRATRVAGLVTRSHSSARRWAAAAGLVLLLPGGALAAETEAELGPVHARVRLEPEAPVIGDPMQLLIEASAEDLVEVLMPDFGDALERFNIVDFVPRERIDEDGRTIYSQRYTLQAPNSGEHVLPAILIEFVDHRPDRDPAPEGQDAYELLTEPVPFEVASVVPDAAGADLSPPMGRLGPLGAARRNLWIWLAVAAALLLGAAPFALRALAGWRAKADAKSAFELARSELDALLAGPRPRPDHPDKIDAFFVELSGIIRRYLERRFSLRSPELTTERFLEVVSASPSLTAAHQELLRDLLRQSDLVKFAHHIPTPEAIQNAIDAAESFLAETRDEREVHEDAGPLASPPPSAEASV